MKSPRILSAFLLAVAAAAFAQQGDEAARRGVESINKLIEQRPLDAALHFYLARFEAQLGDARAATDALEKTAQLGDGFLPPHDGFERVWNDAGFQAARAKMEQKLARLDYAPIAFDLEDAYFIPEGIAYDAPSHTFFMGSIPQHRIVRIDPATKTTQNFAPGEGELDAVLGLTADSPRRILYAVSTSALTKAGQLAPRNAVVAFAIDQHRLLRRYDVPDAQQLNDVAVAPGGRVFVSDSGSGAVYELPVKDPAAPRLVVRPGQLRGSNGVAVSPDAKRLYVAHSTGIAVVDIAGGEVKPMLNETRENVAAIDGLYMWQGQLIGVENVTNPGRVVAITVSTDGARITRVQTLLSHHHSSLDEPTTGVPTANGFFLLAATGVSHYNAEGAIVQPETLPRPTVVRIPLPR
jgi:DNA-binding beta-propeller fold protein YncE